MEHAAALSLIPGRNTSGRKPKTKNNTRTRYMHTVEVYQVYTGAGLYDKPAAAVACCRHSLWREVIHTKGDPTCG